MRREALAIAAVLRIVRKNLYDPLEQALLFGAEGFAGYDQAGEFAIAVQAVGNERTCIPNDAMVATPARGNACSDTSGSRR